MKKLNIETSTVLKCDVCGEYHLETDCEIVTIKIIKGKNCKLVRENILKQDEFIEKGEAKKDVRIKVNETIENKESIEKPVVTEEDRLRKNLENPNIIKLVSLEEKMAYLKRTSGGVPPAFIKRQLSGGDIGISPKDSNFETKGAKIVI